MRVTYGLAERERAIKGCCIDDRRFVADRGGYSNNARNLSYQGLRLHLAVTCIQKHYRNTGTRGSHDSCEAICAHAQSAAILSLKAESLVAGPMPTEVE